MTVTRLDPILVGAWLALLIPIRDRQSHGLSARRALLTTMALSVALLLARGAWQGDRAMDDRAVSTIGYLLFALTGGAALAVALTTPARLFAWRPLRVLGRYSYAAYLLHPWVLTQLVGRGLVVGTLTLAAVCVAVTTGLAAVSWQYLEAPILGRRWRTLCSTRGVTIVAIAAGVLLVWAGGADAQYWTIPVAVFAAGCIAWYALVARRAYSRTSPPAS